MSHNCQRRAEDATKAVVTQLRAAEAARDRARNSGTKPRTPAACVPAATEGTSEAATHASTPGSSEAKRAQAAAHRAEVRLLPTQPCSGDPNPTCRRIPCPHAFFILHGNEKGSAAAPTHAVKLPRSSRDTTL